MPAWEERPVTSFNESCCDGGASTVADSAQPCGCDPGCKGGPYVCRYHQEKEFTAAVDREFRNNAQKMIAEEEREMVKSARGVLATIESHDAKIEGIHDSGKRMTFSSGSMRDPSEGKLDWTRVTFGPLLRRWAKHLTVAEAKYPDAAPGVPNFSLIETQEELLRYKKSAFRHFMSWYYDETDEDHAAAVCFNINGVEIVKAKQRGERIDGIEYQKPSATLLSLRVETVRRCMEVERLDGTRGVTCSLEQGHTSNHRAHENHDLMKRVLLEWAR